MYTTYRFEYCSWTHNDKICEFIHQERDFITKDESCKGSRTKLNFVGKTFKKKNAIYYGNTDCRIFKQGVQN